MMDLQAISRLSREQAKKAARLHKKPYLFEEEDRTTFPPFPFPNIGSYVPKGWELVDSYFCDKFGSGDEGRSMSYRELIKRLKAGYGYAIIEEGEFQLVVGEFRKIGKWKIEGIEHKTYVVEEHINCEVCGECITCGLRPCGDGKEHINNKTQKRLTAAKSLEGIWKDNPTEFEI